MYHIELPAATHTASPLGSVSTVTTLLLVAPFTFVATDIVAGLRYPGYSFTEQAPSDVDPFVLLSIAVGVAAFRGRFRLYSIATIVLLRGDSVSRGGSAKL